MLQPAASAMLGRMLATTFRLETGDRNVGRIWRADQSADGSAALIYCHGWAGRGDTDANPFTAMLRDRVVQRGGVFIDFDFFGCGQTGGDYSQMTYGRWADNLRDVFEYVSGVPGVERSRMAVLGISSGSTAALRFAIASDAPAAVISVATAGGLCIGMPNGPARVFVENLSSLSAGGTAKLFNTEFPIGFYLDFLAHQPIYRMEQIRCPVLFLQGLADNVHRRTDARIAHEQMQRAGGRSELIEIPDGDHGLSNVPEIASAQAIAFLERTAILPGTKH